MPNKGTQEIIVASIAVEVNLNLWVSTNESHRGHIDKGWQLLH
jgi:hypothetical protein